jgi:Leucine-rich repeat (LRR) protein
LDKLVNLKGLYCSYNELTELDLSNLVNLKDLFCGNNKLTELDLSNLVNLQWLDCKKYIKPKPDKLDLLINKVEKLEKVILDLTKGK